MAAERRLKHWGWGYEDQQPAPAEVEAAAEGLRAHLGFGADDVEQPVALADVELRAPRIQPPPALAGVCATDDYERAAHGLGKAYRDIVRGFRGEFPNPPDVVAHPRTEEEVVQVLGWCVESGAAAVPFGGGTSVCGGIELPGDRPVVTIDLRALDRVLEVDEASMAARIQGGATGPVLEDQLREHGLTLRHFPQSFEYATLGGWIATRAGGHFATGPTHIDDLVQSARAITPAGDWESRRLPGSGAGPSPDRMLIGSEGILGLITEAWVRVRERPGFRASAGVGFESFEAGGRAVRALTLSGLAPSNCRLLDPGEAALTGAAASGALLVLGFESHDHALGPWIDRALELCADHGGTLAGEPTLKEPGGEGADRGDAEGSWRDAFLQAPYLRDTMVATGILAETFETAITWDRFDEYVASVRAAAEGALQEICGAGTVTCRTDPRLPRRGGALLHSSRSRQARIRGGPVGRDQGRGVGGDQRRGRHDHAPPRRRPGPPAVVRPPAARGVRDGAARGEGGGRPGRRRSTPAS